jgi:hypothetical protein
LSRQAKTLTWQVHITCPAWQTRSVIHHQHVIIARIPVEILPRCFHLNTATIHRADQDNVNCVCFRHLECQCLVPACRRLCQLEVMPQRITDRRSQAIYFEMAISACSEHVPSYVGRLFGAPGPNASQTACCLFDADAERAASTFEVFVRDSCVHVNIHLDLTRACKWLVTFTGLTTVLPVLNCGSQTQPETPGKCIMLHLDNFVSVICHDVDTEQWDRTLLECLQCTMYIVLQ